MIQVNNSVIYVKISIPFSGEPKKQIIQNRVIARNDVYAVLNDRYFTTVRHGKGYVGEELEKVHPYKQEYKMSDDGWYAYMYSQATEKLAFKKLFNALLKKIQRERYLDSEAIKNLKKLLK